VIDDLDLGMSPETIDILANLVLRSRHQIIATVRSAEFAEALDEAKGSVRVLSFVHSGGETSITDTTPKLSEYESLGDAWEDPMF
jgi:3-methyladenine DNA glycosylase Tag